MIDYMHVVDSDVEALVSESMFETLNGDPALLPVAMVCAEHAPSTLADLVAYVCNPEDQMSEALVSITLSATNWERVAAALIADSFE